MNTTTQPAINSTKDAPTNNSNDDFDSWPAPCTIPFGCSVIAHSLGGHELMEQASNNIFGSVGVAEVATHRSRSGEVYHHPGRSSKFVSMCPVGFTHFGEPGFINRNGSLNTPTQPLAAFARSQIDAVLVWNPFPASMELRMELEFVLCNQRIKDDKETEPWLNQRTKFVVLALEGVVFETREQIVELFAFMRTSQTASEQSCTKILFKPLSNELNQINPYLHA